MRILQLSALLFVILWAIHRAGGREALRGSLGSMLFLFTRRPILLVGAVATPCFVLWLRSEATAHGKPPPPWPMLLGVGALMGLAVAVLVVGVVFFALRARAAAPVLSLAEPGETLLRTIVANHFLGSEARGGKLHITSHALRFVPHRFNVQLACASLPRAAIARVRAAGQSLLIVERSDGGRPEWYTVRNAPSEAVRLEQHIRDHAPNTNTSLELHTWPAHEQ